VIDFSSVRLAASELRLSEATVDTSAITNGLAELKRATLELDSHDRSVAQWLSDEHFAGGVLATAATMNKRAELSGKGNPFNRVSRSTLIDRYNSWATQLINRIDAVQDGSATPGHFACRLAQFKADPINNTP
jgi:hypothetical protein